MQMIQFFLSESKDDLQIMLNEFSIYCKKWKLKINVQKTKISMFVIILLHCVKWKFHRLIQYEIKL
jgi:hypothetical protein